MFKILQTPSIHFENIFEKAKYILVHKLIVGVLIATGVLTIVFTFFFDSLNFTLCITAFLFTLLSLYQLNKTKKYIIASWILNAMGLLLIQTAVFINKLNPHVIEALWMVNNLILAFLTLGKRAGIIIGTLHGLTLTLFYVFFYQNQLQFLYQHHFQTSEIIGHSVNIIAALSLLIYLCYQTLKTNRFATNEMNLANKSINEQFEIISQQNIEKTVLIKEIHHRVKNNLQIIISLLRIQSRKIKNEETISHFNDAINRIIAISSVHEKLFQNKELKHLEIKDYIQSLGDEIILSNQNRKKIDFNFNSSEHFIKLEHTVPLGLIFNELITNTLKHAQTDKDVLQINIQIEKQEENGLKITYSDSGSWKENKNTDTFGLELIDALTEQLRGTFRLSKEPRSEFIFFFNF